MKRFETIERALAKGINKKGGIKMISVQKGHGAINNNIDGELVVPQEINSNYFELKSLLSAAPLLFTTVLISVFVYYNVAVSGVVDLHQMSFNAAALVAVALVPYGFLLEKVRGKLFPAEARSELQKHRDENSILVSLSSKIPLNKSEFLQILCLPSILLSVIPLLLSLILSNYLPSMLASTLAVFFGCSVLGVMKDCLLFNKTIKQVPDNAKIYYNDRLSYWHCDGEKEFSKNDKLVQAVAIALTVAGLVLIGFHSFWCLIPLYVSVFISTLFSDETFVALRIANCAAILDAVLVMTNFFA